MTEIGTSLAARISGWSVPAIHKWRRNGKIKYARRASKAKEAPWVYDREEILSLKNANLTR